ncbi:trypsin-like serine protease [Streptomyces novaecaesareae]|uniref:trypsin-like serine protease n=1 Tax=Streptomyces novaecaesareae TaxID=68244 RepID=UPI000691507E|nr:trypsin-like serine protease [Streptomyces novaecaesareae]
MNRQTQPRNRRAGVLAAALATGALATFSGTPAGAVTGDAAADGSYAATARLMIGDNLRACTGALVDRYWVVTAASCFADDPAQPQALAAGAPKWKTTAAVAGKSAEVAELVPRQDRDLVLARLAAPVDGVTPLALATTAPSAGQTLRVAGFGRTKDEWAPLKLHTGSFSLDTVSATGIGTTGTGGAAICKGDTGAPAIRETGGKAELVAVASRSWQGGCLGTPATETRTGAYNSRVDDLGAWVQQVKASRPGSRLFAVGGDTQIWANEGSYTANVWGTFERVPNNSGIRQVSAVTMGDKVRLFAVGGDNRIYTAAKDTTNNTWSAFEALPSSGIQQVTAVAMGSKVRLFAVGGDGRIWTITGDYTAGTWSTFEALPSSDIKEVSATTVGNTVRLFAIGGDQKIWTTTGDYTAGTWSTFAAIPGSAVQHIAATSIGSTVRVFAVGSDQKIATTDSTDNGPWSALDAVPGGNSAKQVAVTTIGDTIRLFAIGGDDRIWTADKKADGSWTTFYGVSSSSIQNIAATTN